MTQDERSDLPAGLLAAALCSGAAALFYESLWTRSLSLVLGSTVQGSAIVFSAFLVGLALGALVFGRWRRAAADVASTYVGLELSIAVTAPLVGLLLGRHVDTLAVLVGGHGAPLRILRGFAATLLVVTLPTVLMGGTFPILIALAKRASSHQRAVARVYAINTFGAAFGAVACGTLTVGLYGVSASYAVAAAFNLAAAALVFAGRSGMRAVEGRALPAGERGFDDRNPTTLPVLVAGAVSSGAIVLAVEVLWGRFAAYFLGNRTFAVMILLAWVLVLLATGAALAERVERSGLFTAEALLSGAFVLSALGILLSTSAVAWWITRQTAIEASLPGIRALVLFYRTLETGILLSPILLPLGTAFPLCLVGARADYADIGRVVGALYGANTAGAVFGSLLTGGWAVTALGSYTWSRWLAAACVIVAAGIHLVRVPRRQIHAAAWAAALLAVAAVGRFAVPRELSLVAEDERLVRRVEDEYGVFQVAEIDGGLLRTTNNRTALIYLLGSPSTRFVQEMQAHLGVWFLPRAKTAVVLGSGYGITAGAFGLYDGIERVDAVEILPAMVAAAPLFARENFRYHENPKIRVTVDDARHFLTTRAGQYDIVSINVSDAHLPGASALFHSDFYEIVKRRLAPGGIVLQHAFGNDIAIVLRTIAESFPHVRLFRAYDNGMNVVASLSPLAIDEAALRAVVSREKVRSALRHIGFAPPLTPAAFASAGWTARDFPQYFHPSVPIATDDHPRLELSARGGPDALLFSNQ